MRICVRKISALRAALLLAAAAVAVAVAFSAAYVPAYAAASGGAGPESFTVDVQDSSASEMLRSNYNINVGDSLRMDVKVMPQDARLGGKFEWKVASDETAQSGSGGETPVPVTVKPEGDNAETAVLDAVAKGRATLTVSYVADGAGSKLNDFTLVFIVSETRSLPTFLFVAIFIVIVAVIIIVLIIVMNGRNSRRGRGAGRPQSRSRKRRTGGSVGSDREGRVVGRAEMSGREGRAPRRTDIAERESRIYRREDAAERGRRVRDGRGNGYLENGSGGFDRATKVFDSPPIPPAQRVRKEPGPPANYSKNGGKDEPFSLDDIE
jgi:hypothetical protein